MVDVVASQGRFAITPERRTALFIAASAAAGVSQAIMLKKFVDGSGTTVPSWMPSIPQIGTFNQPSALISMGTGLTAILIGLYVPLEPNLRNIAVAYGGRSLAGGIMSGLGILTSPAPRADGEIGIVSGLGIL